MLNGVGGRTIAEAKERLTYHEALRWFAYFEKHGSRRADRLLAQLATMYNTSHGGKAEFEDFYFRERPPMDENQFLDKFMGLFEG